MTVTNMNAKILRTHHHHHYAFYVFKYNILKKQLIFHSKLKINKAYNSRSYKNYLVSHGASSSRSFAVRSL